MSRIIKTIGLAFLCVTSFAIISEKGQAQYFLMQDSTCTADIELNSGDIDQGSTKKMLETVKEEMAQNKFQTIGNNGKDLNDGKVRPGQLYFSVNLSRKGYLFKQCTAHIELKKAKNYRPKESDETLYEGSSTRQFPRITFQGDERCVRAIQDAFIHIPSCHTTSSN